MLSRSLSLVSLALVSMVGCATVADQTDDPSGGDGKADGSGPSLEDQLGALANTPLTTADVDSVLSLLAKNGTTTANMNTVRAFLDTRYDESASGDEADAVNFGETALNIFYMGMPRDIQADAAAGQHFHETTTAYDLDAGNDYSVPYTLKVSGKAAKAYVLHFTMGDSVLDVPVAKGTTASATAKLIANKITDSNEEIFENAASATFNTDHGDSPGMDDIETETSYGTVTILPAING